MIHLRGHELSTGAVARLLRDGWRRLGGAWGLYLVGLGIMSSFVFMVTGAWLLLVGVGKQEAAGARPS
jgi:uncharacterized iron-regulated membrane protein